MTQEKPFIKLLRSPNSGYFFDVNRNEIVPVDDDVYEYLWNEQNDKNGNDIDDKLQLKIDVCLYIQREFSL